jgi:CRISPR type III-B/RAMP module-associated protein Cmr3
MTDWRLVHFEPWDILVNADARGLGDGGYGFEGEIAPAAFAGAIRTLVLRRKGYDFTKDYKNCSDQEKKKKLEQAAKAVGLDGGDFPFRFAGPFPCEKGLLGWDLFFRAPAHLLHAPGNDQVPAGWLVPEEAEARVAKEGGLDDCSLLKIRPASIYSLEQAEPLEGWAHASQLEKILRGDLGGIRKLPSDSDFYARERKEGHRRSKTGTVEEGALFSRWVMRFRDEDPRRTLAAKHFAGLLRLDNDLLREEVYDIRLAGDGRPARLRVEAADGPLRPLLESQKSLAEDIVAAKKFLIYLATPALFEEGWRPKDWVKALGVPEDIGLKLAGACVFPPRILGGWDLKAGRPKPVRRAAPPGSVYFFTYENDWKEDAIAAWLEGLALGRSVSSEDGPLGYGWVLAGLWPEAGKESNGL